MSTPTFGYDGTTFGYGNPTASSVSSALNAAPNLVSQPSMAIAAAGTANPEAAAQVFSQAQNANAASAALSDAPSVEHHRGLFGSIIHSLGTAAKDTGIAKAANYLGAPLREIQHDYRFIHEVYAQHGFFAGALATLGTVGGGAIGALAGPEGAVLGADAGSWMSRLVLGNTVFKDSNQASQGAHISPGRDLAHALGLQNTNAGIGKLVSGVGDATFDLGMDPVIATAKLNQARKAGDLAEGALLGRGTQFNKALQSLAPGLKMTSADQVQAAYDAFGGTNGFNRAVSEIAGLDSAQIVTRFPKIGATAAGALGMAPDEQTVLSIFKTAADHGDQAINTISSQVSGVAQFINKFGAPLDSVKDVEQTLSTVPQAALAVHDMVGKSAEEIAQLHPELAPLAPSIAAQATANDIGDVLRQPAFDAEMAKRINDGLLPSRSLMRVKMSQMAERIIDSGSKALGSADQAGRLSNTFEDAAGNAVGINPWGRLVRTFTGYVPFSVDSATRALSTVKFDPMDPNAGQTVYRALRLGMGGTAARTWTNKFISAGNNIGLKRQIWLQGQVEAMKAFGLPDDANLVKGLVGEADSAVNGAADAVGGGKYEHGFITGDGVNEFTQVDPADASPTYSGTGAVWHYQRGQFSIPQWGEWADAKRALTTYGSIYGKFDDMASVAIQKVFKPLALVNSGFGLRIAMAELIPQYARVGFAQTTKNQILATATRMGYKVAGDEETGHIYQAAAAALGGLSKAVTRSEADRELATKIVVANGGQFVKGVARTGSNAGESSAIPLENALQVKHALLSRNHPFQLIPTGASNYAGWWTKGLNDLAGHVPARQIAQDLVDHEAANPGTLAGIAQAGTDAEIPWQVVSREAQRLRGATHYADGAEIPQNVQEAYGEERRVVQRAVTQPADEFAAQRVDSILGKTIGLDGTVHHDLIQGVADGVKHDVSDLDQIPDGAAPKFVVGMASDAFVTKNPFARILEKGYRGLVDPVINGLSRNPLYFDAVKTQYEALLPAVEKGVVSDDTALSLAMSRASNDILPRIHNTALRSQFSMIAKNFIPFYFAQEQAYRRALHTIGEAPHLLREYQLINNTLHNPAFVNTDDQGNRSVVLPGVGEIGKGINEVLKHLNIPIVTGLPLTYTGNVASLSTVIPEAKLANVSPIVSISGDILTHFLPEANPAMLAIEGSQGYSQPILNEVMPNTFLREEYRAATGHQDDSEIASAMASAMAAAAYHGQLPSESDPVAQQRFIDSLKNNARSALFLKGIVSLFSPLANKPNLEDLGFRDEFYKLLAKPGATYDSALLQFEKEHGPAAQVYTIARSKSVSGATIPTSQQAIDFVNQNTGLLSQYSLAAPFLVPQETGSGSAQVLHQELLTLGLRAQDTPEDLLSKFYVSAGDQQYFAAHKQYLINLAAAANDPVAMATLQADKGDDTSGVDATALEKAAKKTQTGAQVVSNWADWNAKYATFHPLWHADFTSTSRTDNAIQTVNQLLEMGQKGLIPNNTQSQGVAFLASQYFQLLSQVQANAGNTKGAVAARAALATQWGVTLSQAQTEDPGLANVITQVFNRLPTNTSALRQYVDTTSTPVPA